MTVQEQGCWCCGGEAPKRGEDDPWQGCMDGYCAECATNRCDCYPDECPVKHPDGQEIAIKCPKDVQTIREQLQHLGPLRAGAALAALDSLVAYVERLGNQERGLRSVFEAARKLVRIREGCRYDDVVDALQIQEARTAALKRIAAPRHTWSEQDFVEAQEVARAALSLAPTLAPPKESL